MGLLVLLSFHTLLKSGVFLLSLYYPLHIGIYVIRVNYSFL